MTPAEAARIILSHCGPLPAARLPLREALDAVLAESRHQSDRPAAWDNSAMDGYAVRSADLTEPETDLDVIETIAAGQFPQKTVGKAQATRIFTGAPLPQRRRYGDPSGGHRAAVERQGHNPQCARHEEEHPAPRRRLRKGTAVLPAGTALGPAQLGVLASMAYDAPLVHRRPRVAFMGSGDEIVDLEQRDAILAGTKDRKLELVHRSMP